MSPRAPRAREAGITLVEMLVALALFALVGLASFSMLDAVIRTRDRTEGRLDAVATLDRALTLVSRDLGQSDAGSQALEGDALNFSLEGAGGPAAMRYALEGGALERRAGEGDEAVSQRLVEGVADLSWRLLDRAGAWHEAWPDQEAELERLVAAELSLTLTDGGGARGPGIRRLVELPVGAEP